jgi:hypothetical protein
VSYEELEGLCSSGVVHVPQEAVFQDHRRPRARGVCSVHFRGCRVGRNAPFMAKLREALDVPLVTAPRIIIARLFWIILPARRSLCYIVSRFSQGTGSNTRPR